MDPAREYRLATTDYLAAGGDGCTRLKMATVLVDAAGGPLLVNVAADSLGGQAAIAIHPNGRIQPITQP